MHVVVHNCTSPLFSLTYLVTHRTSHGSFALGGGGGGGGGGGRRGGFTLITFILYLIDLAYFICHF